MPYDSLTSRTDAAPLIPEDVSREIIQSATTQSATLALFRRVNLSRNQQRMPVLSALPTAYWVTGDTGLKQTTEAAWANKYLNVEELAAIVPIPDNVVDDVDYDLWGEIRPKVEEAIARALDAAVFFGTNAPGSFPTNVVSSATSAGNNITIGSTVANGGIQNDMDLVLDKVEEDGFDVTGWVAATSLRGALRRARNTLGDRLAGVNDALTEYLGNGIQYPMRGMWSASSGQPRAIALDGTQFVVGVRRDISWRMFDQGVIQDGAGNIVYNLLQQDMQAMRVTFRVAWQVANPLTLDQPVEASRYPAGVLLNT